MKKYIQKREWVILGLRVNGDFIKIGQISSHLSLESALNLAETARKKFELSGISNPITHIFIHELTLFRNDVGIESLDTKVVKAYKVRNKLVKSDS